MHVNLLAFMCVHTHTLGTFLAKSTIAVKEFQIFRKMESHLNTSLGHPGALKGYRRGFHLFFKCIWECICNYAVTL